MTTIVLVRHGEVKGITPPRFRGRDDLPLTPHGLEQAGRSGDVIRRRWTLDALYCSPLTRCVHTAEAIATGLALKPAPHPGLNDIDYGTWQALAVAEVEQRWPEQLARWHSVPHTMRPPDGESLQEVLARATAALSVMLTDHGETTIALVTHDSVIRLLLGHMLSLPVSAYWSLSQSPCAINEIGFADGRFTIHSINETHHLDA